MSDKKTFEVVAYKTTRYVMTVDNASSKEEAKSVAELHECVSDKWSEDWEYFDFSIADVREINEDCD